MDRILHWKITYIILCKIYHSRIYFRVVIFEHSFSVITYVQTTALKFGNFYGLRLFTDNFIPKYKFLLFIYWQSVSCQIAIWKCKQRCRVSSYLVEPNFQQNSIVDQQHFFIFHITLALEKSWHDLYHSSIVHNGVHSFLKLQFN